MIGSPIRVLELAGSPAQMGESHGATYRNEIQGYAAGRVELSRLNTALSSADVLALVEEMIPAHREYSESLYLETEALAAAAGLSVAEAILVSGYTDVLDVVRSRDGGASVEDNCTAVMVPPSLSDEGALFSQTWDMNASATSHVIMLKLTPTGSARAMVFSTVGCVGQIGMNEFGVCLGINNLSAADGRPGVTWPFVVRKALEQTNADDALAAVLDAQLAGGHNFHIVDRSGKGFSVEAMPTAKEVTELDGDFVIRTNHCLSMAGLAREAPRPRDLQENSEQRLQEALRLLGDGVVSVQALKDMTRDERSICRHPAPPYDYETCGAVVMRPNSGEFWACWGRPSENEFERFQLPVTALA